MASLSGFPQGGGPVPELGGYPAINVTRDICAARDEAISMYVEVEDTLLKRLTSVWYKQGFVEALKVAAESQNAANPLLLITATYILKIANLCTKIQHIFQPHLKNIGPKLASLYSHTRDWANSPIRCIVWHPHMSKIAVATADDSVRIYTAGNSLVSILKCSSQKGVSSIAWRPYSVSEIAIGCEIGIIVWTVDPNSTFTKPSISNATILKCSGHSPVTSVGWSPTGDLLASASAADYSIKVWNPAGGEPCTVRRVAGGGTSHLLWAPNGSRLFTATTGIIFRVWETTTWQAERWSVQGGRVQVACWSPCSEILLFATEDEPLIYALKFSNATLFANDSNLPVVATPLIDLTKIELPNGEVAGGRVLNMQWSPRGHHLAITFKDSNLVAVFNINIQISIQVTPCCFVTGIDNEAASTIAFQQKFSAGACLTIGWSSGRVQYYPIIYDDIRKNKSF